MCTLLGAGVLLGLVAVANSVVSTSCECDHFCFQKQLENADVVARVRVKNVITSPVYGYIAYKMKLKKAFKNVYGYAINEFILLTHEDCPAIFEPNGEALLLAGQVYHDYYTYDTYMWVRDCDVNVPWSSFNSEEKKMIKKGKSFTYCDNNPCLNGGTCTEMDNEQCYICECAAGYEGLNCDCDVDYCDFDDNICAWTQGYDDDFDWWRESGPTSSFYTGPNGDHPVGNQGSYIYIEASNYWHNTFADLISPLFTPTCDQAYCFTFVYNMRGPHVEILEIFLYTPGGNTQTLWQESGNQGNQWHTAGVGFSTDQPFQIVIRGTIGASFMSDIAVDNVCLKLGECC